MYDALYYDGRRLQIMMMGCDPFLPSSWVRHVYSANPPLVAARAQQTAANICMQQMHVKLYAATCKEVQVL